MLLAIWDLLFDYLSFAYRYGPSIFFLVDVLRVTVLFIKHGEFYFIVGTVSIFLFMF